MQVGRGRRQRSDDGDECVCCCCGCEGSHKRSPAGCLLLLLGEEGGTVPLFSPRAGREPAAVGA